MNAAPSVYSLPPDLVFEKLLDHFSVRPDGQGNAWIACPSCGKDRRHFSFSQHGFHCFVCDFKGSVYTLAKLEHVVDSMPARPVTRKRELPPPPPAKLPEWSHMDLKYYLDHPKRFEAWQAYKPLTEETIIRHKLGYGRIPFKRPNGQWYMSKREWLVVPLFEGKTLVGLRGRNTGVVDEHNPKWISATGSKYVLWNVDNVRPGSVVYITENYIDAALLIQFMPGRDACAIGGASTWQTAWANRLASRKPSQVIVALDNDLAGQATGAMYERLAAEWRAEKPGIPIMQPNGPKIANALRRLGVETTLWEWQDKPAKYDMGQFIMEKLSNGERK